MPSRPRISIITPTFNSAAHLEQTIQSVLSQGHPKIEYLIIDGGSSDGTLEIIRRHENRLAGWVSEPDQGIADAFNKGVRHATGDLIGIINSDDSYAPGALAAVAEAHRAHPRAILHGDVEWIEGGVVRRLRPAERPERFRYLDMPFFHPTCFVPRAVYERVGFFDLSYRVAMDYEWVLRAMRGGCEFVYLPRVLARFQAGGASMASRRRTRREALRAQLRSGLNPLICLGGFALKTGVMEFKELFGMDTKPRMKGG